MKVNCPNILASCYAQKKLVDEGICEWLGRKNPIETSTFTIVFPPCYCCYPSSHRNWKSEDLFCDKCNIRRRYGGCPIHNKNDKPLILKDDGKAKIEEYTDMFDALKFLVMTNKKSK